MESQKAKLQNWKKTEAKQMGKKRNVKKGKHWKTWICPFAFSLHLFCFLDVFLLLLGCFCFCFLPGKNKQTKTKSKQKNTSKKQNKCKNMQMDKLVHCFPIFSHFFPFLTFLFFMFPFFSPFILLPCFLDFADLLFVCSLFFFLLLRFFFKF